MPPETVGAFGLAAVFVLMAIGMPVAFSMALVGIGGFALVGGISGALVMTGTSPFATVCNYEMSVVPLFVLMGSLAIAAGLTKDAYLTAHMWVGRLPGGLAIATILGCAAFAACTASSVASIGVISSMALPEMKRYNYDVKLATGCVASGCTLGILIPPSLSMIVYGIIAEVSIGKLFLAGVLPGILLTSLFVIVILFMVWRNPSLGPRGSPIEFSQKLRALKNAWPLLLLMSIVVIGIWGGIFTPLEAGGAAAFTAFLIGVLRKRLDVSKIVEALTSSLRISVMIFAIMIGAIIFNYFMALTQLPNAIANSVSKLPISPNTTVILVMVFYIIGGCFMDAFGLMMLTLPIFIPIMSNMSYDLILFGVLTTVTIEMAFITPPMGLNAFILSSVAENIPTEKIFIGIIPFLAMMVVGLALLIAFPWISLALPSAMIK